MTRIQAMNSEIKMEDKLKKFEESFKEVRQLLNSMNRDSSRVGRLNEFTRSIMESLCVFSEFVEKVIRCELINLDTFDYFEKNLVDALEDFTKLKRIYNKN